MFNSKNSLLQRIVTEMKEHLQTLSQLFQGYFHHREVFVLLGWMQNSFIFDIDSMDDSEKINGDLVDMKASNRNKI